jgi:hypothetical protein
MNEKRWNRETIVFHNYVFDLGDKDRAKIGKMMNEFCSSGQGRLDSLNHAFRKVASDTIEARLGPIDMDKIKDGSVTAESMVQALALLNYGRIDFATLACKFFDDFSGMTMPASPLLKAPKSQKKAPKKATKSFQTA